MSRQEHPGVWCETSLHEFLTRILATVHSVVQAPSPAAIPARLGPRGHPVGTRPGHAPLIG